MKHIKKFENLSENRYLEPFYKERLKSFILETIPVLNVDERINDLTWQDFEPYEFDKRFMFNDFLYYRYSFKDQKTLREYVDKFIVKNIVNSFWGKVRITEKQIIDEIYNEEGYDKKIDDKLIEALEKDPNEYIKRYDKYYNKFSDYVKDATKYLLDVNKYNL